MRKKTALKIDESRLRDELIQERCTGPCGRVYPLEESYFHRDSTSETGFMSVCKACRSEQRRAEEGKTVIEALDRLEQRAISVLDETLESPNVTGVAHAATTFEDLMTLFGGSQGFAKHVLAQYLTAPAGGPGRTKILSLLLNLQLKLTEAGHATQPTDQMSDEELKAALAKKLAVFKPATIHDAG